MEKPAKKTKIIATLGPVSEDSATIRRMIEGGADLFRLNFSHGNHEWARMVVNRIRTVSAGLGRHVGVFIDLQGPKIRINRFVGGAVNLERGQAFTLCLEDLPGDSTRVSTTYANLVHDAVPGDVILLDDGRLRLEVTGTDGSNVNTRVRVGGKLSDRKGMNLPGMKLSIPSLTDKDKDDVLFGITAGVDYFALSFVRQAADVVMLKEFLRAHGADIPVIAKIEKPEAVENLAAIIQVSDAVMVARGDLGVEVPMEKVPAIQREIIRQTNHGGKPVIVATQMLESMIQNSVPTRAEVSDVATAVHQGADAVMLSGESAMGKYPVEAVSMMARIAAEEDFGQAERKRKLPLRRRDFLGVTGILSSMCDVADMLADRISASAMVTFTHSGRTALLLSRYHVSMPVIAVSDSETTCRQLSLYRGVIPLLASRKFAEMTGVGEMRQEVERQTLEKGLLKQGDVVVMVAGGVPIVKADADNTIRVHRIGEPLQN